MGPTPDEPGIDVPWGDSGGRTIAVVVRASGPDPSVDRLFALEAVDLATAERRFTAACDPAPAAAAWAALEDFLAGRALLVADGGTFRAWRRHFMGARDFEGPVLGLDELVRWLLPGEIPRGGDCLAWLAGKGAASADDLLRATQGLAARFHRRLDEGAGERGLLLLALSWLATWRALREAEPEAARELELVLRLIDDGRLAALLSPTERARPVDRARDLLDALRPACARAGEAAEQLESVPTRKEGAQPFHARDLALLDDVFTRHIPALLVADGLAAEGGGYRAGQHAVARSIAQTLGERELLLVHAPTGTGKTLAYLVPALLWSLRHGVRVGISTYTRALQEQAVRHEVPRALRALLRAKAFGGSSGAEPRVSQLKGRENYLCWRALELHLPGAADGPEAWSAWSMVLLFALSDPAADLDHFPRQPWLRALERGGREQEFARELEALVRAVRAHGGCCTSREDRATCGAEVARAVAEKSHVVITNHSFALARQEYFRHVIFDECEHLHEQAHAAWSLAVSLRDVREQLRRLHDPGPASRAPLDRLARLAPPDSLAADVVRECRVAWATALGALQQLEAAARAFFRWRERERRTARDEHSLFREYGESERGAELLAARADLADALALLGTGLTGASERLETLPFAEPGGRARLRRTLELERAALELQVDALEAWIPLADGRPAFRKETFHDLEDDPRRGPVLAARVLLPNEYLGRAYYPQLESAVFVSATTWLRGGFEAARAYLGLDRSAEPRPDEARPPCNVRTFRAPDPFDYRRVIVCVPSDAPPYGGGGSQRGAFDAYVRTFIAHLGERTRGRLLALFTNSDDVRRTGQELRGFFAARRIPFWYQGMPGLAKEELGALFRARVDSVLLGVDTFWYGADFPGETLEYLVIVKLPYGVPDRYHHAQCAALGTSEQRRRIYMPRALAKFRQGFGRLMRRESDRGCVFVLDSRAMEPRHRAFLAELPVTDERFRDPDDGWTPERARLVHAPTDECVRGALEHMDLWAEVCQRGLDLPFAGPRARERAHDDAAHALDESAPDDLPP
jgi:ATP-dependent DNA helicase DinG